LWLSGSALAEQALVVNGAQVPGLNGQLVPGTAYAPADAYAQALGASYGYNYDTQLATFQLGADIAVLKVYASAGEAARDKSALQLGGHALDSPGGILSNGTVYVPVKQLAKAFGATVSYLAAQNTVYVVFPRAQVTLYGPTAQPGGGERFTLSLSAPVSVKSHEVKAIHTVLFRFAHSDLAQARQLSDTGFSDATLAAAAGDVELRLTLEPGYAYQSYSTPQGKGFSFVVDVFPASKKSAAPVPKAAEATVVLDPGGGQDTGPTFPGVGSEGTLTLTFAKRVAAALEASGVTVKLTREGDQALDLESRSRAGIGADLFVSIHALPLPSGQYDLYYLGGAADGATLNAAIRKNAQGALSATDSLRRRILLKLIPDLSIGQQDARTLSGELAQSAGFNAKVMASAPLYVLGGAAGRGLYLEFSPQDLLSADFAKQFAQALTPLAKVAEQSEQSSR
jgi:N-acetylmuramoyl-L-alanine amidase